jgi:hypothetical protein
MKSNLVLACLIYGMANVPVIATLDFKNTTK